jgi:hypothetical protein
MAAAVLQFLVARSLARAKRWAVYAITAIACVGTILTLAVLRPSALAVAGTLAGAAVFYGPPIVSAWRHWGQFR